MTPKPSHPAPILWQRGLVWLVLLGPFFFLTYGYTNHITDVRGNAGVYVYNWEHHIPFVPWLMLPYMSIDCFYGTSLFLFRKRRSLDRHACRLLLASVISCTLFLLFPLRFSFDVPHADGFNGMLQKILLSNDRPFNQAPSLHIGLLVILWDVYAHKIAPWMPRLALHLWFFAVGISVLLVYQHHFIDVWTGALVGISCLYFIPELPDSWHYQTPTAPMKTLSQTYSFAAVLCLGGALELNHDSSAWGLLLLWPALALALVAAAYAGFGSTIFQRHNGVMRWPAQCLLAPYLLGAWLNTTYHKHHRPELSQVATALWLGAYPGASARSQKWHAVLDLTNEFPRSSLPAAHKRFLPVMDLTAPSVRTLIRACRWIESQQQEGRVLVHCALGLSRSACVTVCWLAWHKSEANLDQIIAELRHKRPGLVLTPEHKANIVAALHVLTDHV